MPTITPNAMRGLKRIHKEARAAYFAARAAHMDAARALRCSVELERGRLILAREDSMQRVLDARFWYYTYAARLASHTAETGAAWSTSALERVRRANSSR